MYCRTVTYKQKQNKTKNKNKTKKYYKMLHIAVRKETNLDRITLPCLATQREYIEKGKKKLFK